MELTIVRTLAIVFDPVRSMNSPCLQAEALNLQRFEKNRINKGINPLAIINADLRLVFNWR